MVLGFLDRFDDVLVKPFVSDGAVVTLDIGVLLRLSWLDMLDDNPVFLSPNQQLTTDVFRAVVDPYGAGLAAPIEPRRVCRRLQLLSRMEHHEQDNEQVFPRSA